jgi:8-oxo-dGTP pyrophosphatase MutT (NUDIX family)
MSPPASALHDDASRVLGAWRPTVAGPEGTAQNRLRREFIDHLRAHPDGQLKSCGPTHLTASTLVLDQPGERALLTLHRKGGFWGQFGGHCEPADTTLAGAALREAREESGIEGLVLLGGQHPQPVDLDRHRLSAAFGSCREHLDVRFAAVAAADATPRASDESQDVAWWPVDALPPGSVDDLARLVAAARAALSAPAARG